MESPQQQLRAAFIITGDSRGKRPCHRFVILNLSVSTWEDCGQSQEELDHRGINVTVTYIVLFFFFFFCNKDICKLFLVTFNTFLNKNLTHWVDFGGLKQPVKHISFFIYCGISVMMASPLQGTYLSRCQLTKKKVFFIAAHHTSRAAQHASPSLKDRYSTLCLLENTATIEPCLFTPRLLSYRLQWLDSYTLKFPNIHTHMHLFLLQTLQCLVLPWHTACVSW